MSEPIAMCFSGGKDSALALHHLRTYRERQLAEHDLACLFPI
ncbi:MAG: hypothetical protein OSB03_20110 [Vicinamibacterales bacterium]|jgi:tRNA(Ile)-lysidine synthase TilS/MesJ|nr:hypothetical protein [Vicinamibacterales bacterium]